MSSVCNGQGQWLECERRLYLSSRRTIRRQPHWFCPQQPSTCCGPLRECEYPSGWPRASVEAPHCYFRCYCRLPPHPLMSASRQYSPEVRTLWGTPSTVHCLHRGPLWNALWGPRLLQHHKITVLPRLTVWSLTVALMLTTVITRVSIHIEKHHHFLDGTIEELDHNFHSTKRTTRQLRYASFSCWAVLSHHRLRHQKHKKPSMGSTTAATTPGADAFW